MSPDVKRSRLDSTPLILDEGVIFAFVEDTIDNFFDLPPEAGPDRQGICASIARQLSANRHVPLIASITVPTWDEDLSDLPPYRLLLPTLQIRGFTVVGRPWSYVMPLPVQWQGWVRK